MVLKMRALAGVLSVLLSGCANVAPMEFTKDKPVTPESAADALLMTERWNTPSVVQEGKAAVVLLSPYAIPDEVRAKKITIELEPGAVIQDVVAVLGKLNVPVILSDQTVAGKEFYLPHFKGTLGGLLSAVTRSTDVWFTWHEGTIIVSGTERIGISMPQEAAFSEQLSKGLDALGIKDKSVSWQAGMAVIDISPSQFRKVRAFLERMTSNAAVVSLQVAVVNVTLNQNVKQGIDWDKLSLSALRGGNQSDLKSWQTALASGSSATGSPGVVAPVVANPAVVAGAATGTTAAPVTDPTAAVSTLRALTSVGMTGSGLTGALFNSRFSFTGLFNFLQNYGEAETKQNVILKTVGGNKVEFKSLMQIPYVSEIGVTTTTAGAGTAALGSSKTEKADDGISVEMTPMYDASANSVTIDLKLSIKAVVAFNELSAGNQLGKLTMPTTAERSFTDTLRLRPGETAVVGGLTYDSVSNNRNGPIFLQGSTLESQSMTVNRQTMFIVVRPTVLKLGQALLAETGDVLDLLPGGKSMPVEETAKRETLANPVSATKGD